MSTRLALLACLLASAPADSLGGDGSVRAVLFVSPTCPHCRTVEDEALPAFGERFGARLQIALVSTATPSGLETFRAACQLFGVRRPGVPMLVVKDRALLGSQEIPERFPDLAEELLAAGGSAWPDIPGLAALVADAEPAAAPEPPPPSLPPARRPPSRPALVRSTPPEPMPDAPQAVAPAPRSAATAPVSGRLPALPDDRPPGLVERFALDPYGNSLAVMVLVAMLAVISRSALLVRSAWPPRRVVPESWAAPALSLAGLGVASYLAWVEIGHLEAVCGPLGDCNTVQQSEYASFFGLVPIGVLGVAGFAATFVVWVLGRVASGRAREHVGAMFLAVTGLGTLFSIYLTFLEPFVIGATCLWCLSSATIMTLLHWLSLQRVPPLAAEPFRRASPARPR